MEHTKILDLLDHSPTIRVPITPTNTEVELLDNESELIMPTLLLDGKKPSAQDLKKINQVISFSGTDISNTPTFSSSTKYNSSDSENNLKDYKKELRTLKYKLVCLDMEKREVEEVNLKLYDDLEIQQYDLNKLKKKLINIQHENNTLKKELVNFKEDNLNSFIISIIGVTSFTCAILLKHIGNFN